MKGVIKKGQRLGKGKKKGGGRREEIKEIGRGREK